jgi:hypothetical protein
VSPPKHTSVQGDAVKYYPLSHPAHHPVDWELENVKRKAAEDEHRLHELEVHRRWAEEDAERKERRLRLQRENQEWEAQEKARREKEDRDREAFNRKEAERREKEKQDRSKAEQERKRIEEQERRQRESELERRKKQTQDALNDKIKDDIAQAPEFKKFMPNSYEVASAPNIVNVKNDGINEVKSKPKSIKKIKSRSYFKSF